MDCYGNAKPLQKIKTALEIFQGCEEGSVNEEGKYAGLLNLTLITV